MPPLLNFVHGEIQDWADVSADDARNISFSELAPRIRMGREIWLVQAFQALRQRGHPVRLSGRFDPDAINIAHCDDIRPTPDLWQNFIVSVRADRDPAFVSQLEIVQNRFSIWSETDHFIPHWPQPGLLPRNPNRGGTVENIVYMGKNEHLGNAFKTDRFGQDLNRMGMRLIIQEQDWWDYRDADVVLAIRGGTQFYLSIKPASKLINAWLAGCPAILGPEPGYSELRQSELDYFEAVDPIQVLGVLSKLCNTPRLMSRMIENGYRRAREYDAIAVADRWEEFLVRIATPAFHRWRYRTPQSVRRARYLGNLVRRRIWGDRAVGRHQAPWKEALGKVRRKMILPRSARAV